MILFVFGESIQLFGTNWTEISFDIAEIKSERLSICTNYSDKLLASSYWAGNNDCDMR